MAGGVDDPGPGLSGYANSGLHRFATPSGYEPYTPGRYSVENFQAPTLAPLMRAASPSVGGPAPGGLLGGYGDGASMGAPDASTNPGLSNSVATGLLGMVLGPAAAMAFDASGVGDAGSGGGSSASATVGDSGVPAGAVAGAGLSAIGPTGDGTDGGGGGGGGK